MKKLSSILVTHRIVFFSIWVGLALLGSFFIFRTTINYDLSVYLPEDSRMSEGLTLMKGSFGEEASSQIDVMFKDLSDDDEEGLDAYFEALDQVTVSHDESSEYHEGVYTLYRLKVSDDAHSDASEELYLKLQEDLSDYDVFYGGEIPDAQSNYLMTLILWASVLLFVVLFLLGKSWFEPLIFIVTIGIAVLLNYGTNFILPQVSDITFTLAAVLQLVLSIDYSIMLSERYRQEREMSLEPREAMKEALRKSMRPISASSFTTILGLLVLLLMSFTIGIDMGVMLAKGIFFSYLTTFFILPTLMIQFDRLIRKTIKAIHKNHSSSLAKGWMRLAVFEHKIRYFLVALFVLLISLGVYVNQHVTVDYFLPSNAKDAKQVEAIFPSYQEIVLLYPTSDEVKMNTFLNDITELDGTLEVTGYATTIGRPLDADTLAQIMNLNLMVVRALIYHEQEAYLYELSMNQFGHFILDELLTVSEFSSYFDDETQSNLATLVFFTTPTVLMASYDAATLGDLLTMDETTLHQLIDQYHVTAGEPSGETVELHAFLLYLSELTDNPLYQAMFTADQINQLHQLAALAASGYIEETYTVETLSLWLTQLDPNWNESLIELVYLLHSSALHYNEEWRISLDDLVTSLAMQAGTDPLFQTLLTEESLDAIGDSVIALETAKTAFVATDYSRVVVSTPYTLQDEEALPYMNSIVDLAETHDVSIYCIGQIPMAYEMDQTFDDEYFRITLISVGVIFLVILISFQSVFVPVFLVALVQTSIYLSMSMTLIVSSTIYFLALVLVQAILIGAAIDYAILLTHYYREERLHKPVKEALLSAYQGASPAILTSSMVLIVIAVLLGIIVTNATIAAILITLAIGFMTSIGLTLLVLPGILVVFDKAVVWTWRKG